MRAQTVDAKTLKRWLELGDAVLVDVREPAEHAAESIQGSYLIPLSQVRRSVLPWHEEKKMVLHCHSGKRSTSACEKLLQEDSTIEIYTLEGGISAWGGEGFPMESSGGICLPLDRQVQLIIGLMLIVSSVLGGVFSPLWFLFTGFLGVGLSVAGLTGFCGLAELVAKMPWNQKPTEKVKCCR